MRFAALGYASFFSSCVLLVRLLPFFFFNPSSFHLYMCVCVRVKGVQRDARVRRQQTRARGGARPDPDPHGRRRVLHVPPEVGPFGARARRCAAGQRRDQLAPRSRQVQ